jgi:hypothetical protein
VQIRDVARAMRAAAGMPNWLTKRKDRRKKSMQGLINSISIRRVNHELTFG